LSPRTLSEKEKRHHSRRKSGKEFIIVTEKRPSSRPAPVSRRSAPQYVTKVGPAYSGSGRSSSRHNRELEREDEETGRDSAESFPQYWYVNILSLFLLRIERAWEKSWRPQKPLIPRKETPTMGCRFGIQADE
jgi:hypothetical protein